MGYLGVGGGDGFPGVSQASEIGDRPGIHLGFRVFIRILFGHALELDIAGIGESIFQIEGAGQSGHGNPQTAGGVGEDRRGAGSDAAVPEETFVVEHRIFEEVSCNFRGVGEVGIVVHHLDPSVAGSGIDGEDQDGKVGSFHPFDDRSVDVIIIRQIDLEHRERRGAARAAVAGIEIVGVAFDGPADFFQRVFRQMTEGVHHVGIGCALRAGELIRFFSVKVGGSVGGDKNGGGAGQTGDAEFLGRENHGLRVGEGFV